MMAASTMTSKPIRLRATGRPSVSTRSSAFLSGPSAIAPALRRAAPARQPRAVARAEGTPYDAEAARRNADEAREWIARWRAKIAAQDGGVNPAIVGAMDTSAALDAALERQINGGELGPEPYDPEAAAARAADARAWIARWRAKVAAPSPYDEADAKERASDARAWINRWRSKKLAEQRQARWPAGLMTKEQEAFALGLQLSRGGEGAEAGGADGAAAAEAEEGCTDPRSENYNPAAVYDDGSCLYNFDAFDLDAK